MTSRTLLGVLVAGALSASCLPLLLTQAASDAAQFTGTWVYSSGTRTTVCSDGKEERKDLQGLKITLTPGAGTLPGGGDLLWEQDGCTFGYDAVELQAYVVKDTTCYVTRATLLVDATTASTDKGGFVISPDGKTLEQTATVFSLSHVAGLDFSTTCTETFRGSLDRQE